MKKWSVKTGSIDIVGVSAENPSEAATLVFEQIKEESKIDTYDNRIFRIGLVTECIELNKSKKIKDATYYVLTSKILANAVLHQLSKQMEDIEKKLDKKDKNKYNIE